MKVINVHHKKIRKKAATRSAGMDDGLGDVLSGTHEDDMIAEGIDEQELV
jgi:hypothetical protein